MSSTAAPSKPMRRPRYFRTTPVSGQITPRDIEIVRQVARHRFLSTPQIADLLAAPEKKIIDRLTFLFTNEYLDRPLEHRKIFRAGGGSERMVYALARRGAQLLLEHGGAVDPSLDWSRKNREATHRFIHHTLAIAEVRVGLVRAIRSRPGFELLEPEQLITQMPSATQAMANPWLWKAHVTHNAVAREVSLVPDYAFAIRFPDGKRRACLVECDRGTMPIDRTSLDQTSVVKKFLAYTAGKRAKLHQRQFDWKAFRVLFITNTAERAQNLTAAIRERVHADGHDLFLITDRASLIGADILAHPWLDARGRTHSLAA